MSFGLEVLKTEEFSGEWEGTIGWSRAFLSHHLLQWIVV